MSVLRRLKWGASQVTTRHAREEFARMLPVDRLPGVGWELLDERAWKTGQSNADEPWARRARAAKSLTVWRSFEQSVSARWLWVQVTPLTSESDAAAALEDVPSRLLANRGAEVTVTSSEDVEPLPIGGEHAGWANEQRTIGPQGPGISLISAFVVGSTMSAMAASGSAGAWDWQQVGEIAQLQADLL